MLFTKLLAANLLVSIKTPWMGKRKRGIERTIARYEIGMLCSMHGMMRNICNTSARQCKARYINEIQQDATVCRCLFTAKLLSTCFWCPSHPSSGEHKTVTAASGTGHSIWATTFLQRGLNAAVTVLCSPDDGCDGHPKHVESDFAVNKNLHTVASCCILINIKLRCTEPWI